MNDSHLDDGFEGPPATAALNGSGRDLTFVKPGDPPLRRLTMGAIEDLLGRRHYVELYRQWQRDIAPGNPRMLTDLLAFIEVPLRITTDEPWPLHVPDGLPIVMIANHPFGLGDGIVACALAEQLGRPYKVIINNDLLNIPEIRPHALPIDFNETREAMQLNLRSRADAKGALDRGETVVIFPAGGIATAANPFGRAEELPWKSFVARLVQQSRASVLPLFFPGQNSAAFHVASRLGLTWRLSLLISEFKKFPGRPFDVRIGRLTAFSEFASGADRKRLTDELYLMVQRLDPRNAGRSDDELAPTPLALRPTYPGV